ncbi:MAG TPA: hypothetical protein P5150_05380 [Candidatus Ratteibacteria bacterium]|nr:hypothetical protein [Candidatus Ratteibacteria bacterium]
MDIYIECFSSLGNSVEHGQKIPVAKTLFWPDEEIYRIVNEMKRYNFSVSIPYIEPFPYALFNLKGRKIRDFKVAHDEYLARIKRFVEYAHDEKIKVFLYFPVGIASISTGYYKEKSTQLQKRYLLGYEIMEHFPTSFTYDCNGFSSWERLVEGKDNIAFMSLANFDVRSYFAESYLTIVENVDADGIQLEPLSMPLDKDGVCIFGYEKSMVNAFIENFGRKPKNNNDSDWVIFRGNCAIEFVKEIKEKLFSLKHPIEFSTVGYSLKDDIRHFWPWQKMIKEGLIDAFYFRTTSSENLQERIREVKETCEANNPYCRFVGCLDIKNYSQFKNEKEIANGVKKILNSGAKFLGIYGLRWTKFFNNPKERDLKIWENTIKQLQGGVL